MNEIPHLVPISVFSFAKIQLYTVFSKFCPIKLFNMTNNFIGSGQPYNVPRVPINPLIAFVTATERRKKSIVKEQKKPSVFKVAPYATARAAMKKYVKGGFEEECILDALQTLQSRQTSSVWAKNDVANSIIALRHFIEINFPDRVGKIHCTFPKVTNKECIMAGVQITVAPDLIMRWEDNGNKYVGAVKFRIAKNKLDFSAGRNAASLISYFLQKSIAKQGEIVDNAHCFFVDVMADVIYPAPLDTTLSLQEINDACLEYVTLWNAA